MAVVESRGVRACLTSADNVQLAVTFTSIEEVRKEAWRRRTAGTGTWYQLYGGYKEPSVALPANVIVLSSVPDKDEILRALIARVAARAQGPKIIQNNC